MRFTKRNSQRQVVIHPDTSIYQFQQGEQLKAGALSWAFDMLFALPTIVYRGPGRTAGQLSVYPNASQVYSPLAIPMQGLGGLQAGKFILSPLVDATGE
jgi:hypothetical protein